MEQCIGMEDHVMSLIRNGYAVCTRRAFLGGLFSALLVLALFDNGAATAQEVKQIKLTDKHIQGFMAAYDDIAKLYYGATITASALNNRLTHRRAGFVTLGSGRAPVHARAPAI